MAKSTRIKKPAAAAQGPRKIPGNLPYLPGPGTLKKALEGIVGAQRPDKFNPDFLESILQLKGGATVPIFKKMGLVASDGSPTELYSRFKTDSGRGAAALQAIKNAYPEIYKRSEYAHRVTDAKIKDIIVEITGLQATDPIVSYIKSTFNIIKSYIGTATLTDDSQTANDSSIIDPTENSSDAKPNVGLSYHINIVIPETSNVAVLNAIFRALKENLLR
ncbi:MAG: DUF5343 domain-containing protein [Methylocella sp.]